MKKQFFCIFGVCVFLSVFLFAGTPLFAQEVTVRYTKWVQVEEEATERVVIAEFERLNPDIKVAFEPMTWADYERVMITKLIAGTAPDAISFSDEICQWTQWANLGRLMPLDDFIEEDSSFDIDDFFPRVVDVGRYDGVKAGQGPIYGIAPSAAVWILHYNKEMFDKYGISYPDDSWDWDRLIEETLKFRKDRDGDGVFDQYGFYIENIWWDAFIDMIMRAFGTTLWSEDGKSCNAGTPRGLAAIQFIGDLTNKHHIMPKFSERTKELTFENGNLAIHFFHSYWMPLVATRASFEWDIAFMPSGPLGPNSPLIMGRHIGINAKSEVKDATWCLIKFVTSKQAQLIRLDQLSMPPPRRSVTQSEEFKAIETPASMQVLVDSMERGHVYPNFPAAKEGWETLHGAYDKVVIAGKSAEKYIPRAIEKIEKILTRED